MSRLPSPLPEGFAIELDRDVRRFDADRLLLGGAPPRALRLTSAGAAALRRLRRGEGGLADRHLGRRLLAAGLAHPRPPGGSPELSVAVAIPVRDRAAELAGCLEALGDAAPVLVVDDGSADPAAVAAVTIRHRAEYLRRERAGGPAVARNLALERLDADVIAFLDSDCVPEREWLRSLLAYFADPELVAVAPRVRPLRDGGGRGGRRGYADSRSPLDLGPHPGAVGPGRRIPYVPSAALLVRRTAVGAIRFDPELRYGEDVDLVWRLARSGAVRYAPQVTVWHREPARWSGLLARRARYGTSAAALAVRHPDSLAALEARSLPALSAALLICGWPLAAWAPTSSAALRLERRLRALGAPTSVGAKLAAGATVATLEGASRAAIAHAAPGLLALAVRGGARRRAVAIGLLAFAPLAEWARRRPRLDPLRWTAAYIADEMAYGVGVWVGCLRAGSFAPLLPRVGRGGIGTSCGSGSARPEH